LYSELAQKFVDEFISAMRKQPNLSEALNHVLENVAMGTNADRGLIILVVGPKMKVTHEYSTKSASKVLGLSLNPMDSASLVLNLLGNSVDGSYIKLDRTDETAEIWSALFKISEGYMSSLLLPFTSCGTFMGFLALQSQAGREWTDEEVATSVKVMEVLSIPLWYEFQHWRETGSSALLEGQNCASALN
jgi:GAF domain-containing protein